MENYEIKLHKMIPESIGENNAPAEAAAAPHLSDLEVMEHTASVWKYRGITDDGTELHDESHSKLISGNGCEIIGARVRGKKHKHEGTNCDDWFETAIADGCLIAVTADGAGSKKLSRIGARVTCESAVGYISRKLSGLLLKEPDIRKSLASDITGAEFMSACGKVAAVVQDSARAAFDAVIAELQKVYNNEVYSSSLGRNPVLADFFSTFLAAAVIPLENGESLAVTAQIGDGCICAINTKEPSKSCLKLLGEADSGAFSGETEFLSDKNVSGAVIGGKTRISRGRSDVIMLMSDGVADDYFPPIPMMKRLYIDLCLNGILPLERASDKDAAPLPPEPISFPSVSEKPGNVCLQYAKRLEPDFTPETADALWDKLPSLYGRSLSAYGMSLGDSPEKRLLTWLDNYNERGSFDDRTLVIMRLRTDF